MKKDEILKYYKEDFKKLSKIELVIHFIAFLTVILFMIFSLLVENLILSIISLVLLVSVVLIDSELDLTYKFLCFLVNTKKIKLNTDNISSFFKYGEFRVLSQWDVKKKVTRNNSYVTLNDDYVSNVDYEYLLYLGIWKSIKINKELYKKLLLAKNDCAILFINEKEYELMEKEDKIDDLALI